MDMELKVKVECLWQKCFDGAELPISFFYANERPARTYMEESFLITGSWGKVRRRIVSGAKKE